MRIRLKNYGLRVNLFDNGLEIYTRTGVLKKVMLENLLYRAVYIQRIKDSQRSGYKTNLLNMPQFVCA